MKFNSIIETDVSEMVVCLPIFFFGRCATLWSTQSSKMGTKQFSGNSFRKKIGEEGKWSANRVMPWPRLCTRIVLVAQRPARSAAARVIMTRLS